MCRSFCAVVVFCLGKILLFESILGRCVQTSHIIIYDVTKVDIFFECIAHNFFCQVNW